jgi:signal peptidase I
MFLDISSELLSLGYKVRFRPAGQSMHPTIRDGETVTVEPLAACAVRRGDIILYVTQGRLIAHRVVRLESVEEARFILRGDAVHCFDAPVGAEQILGRVIAVERAGRSVNLARKRTGLRLAMFRLAMRLRALVRGAYSKLFSPQRTQRFTEEA